MKRAMEMIDHRPVRLLLSAALLAAALTSGNAHAIVVTNADGVCPSNADPCNVTQQIDIPERVCTNDLNDICATNGDCTPPGECKFTPVILDFGTRDVNVTGAGQFNFGQASGSILTGGFTANTTGVAIDANAVETGGGTDSGSVHVHARRLCTVDGPGGDPFPCLSLSDCQLGSCAGKCTLRPTRVCAAPGDCSAGPCRTSAPQINTCEKERQKSCTTNTDCELGPCSGPLSCRNRPSNPVSCSANADCDFGTCTVGTASITMGGSIVGNSEYPAFIDLRAADNVSVSKTINLAGTTPDSDGGELSLDATFGSVSLSANVTATGGGFSSGGDITFYAGNDVTVTGEIDLTGGDSDGGALDIEGGRDVTIGRSVFANSGAGAGSGGDITIVAGRDMALTAISAANKTTVESSGHTDAFNDAGDGGYLDFSAERNLALNVNTRVLANGAVPYGYGGDITLGAYDGNIVLNGDIVARSSGAQGAGGAMDIFSGANLTFGNSGVLDLTGGADGGGEANLDATGNATYAGQADMSATNTGSGGTLFVRSEADATVSGTMTINTGNIGRLDVEACRITLTSTGVLDSDPTIAENTLTAHESMRLLTGSQMKTGVAGKNFLVYRTASKPPVVQGTVTPAPTLVLDPTLPGCPVCGNSELDQTETCDDGNTTNGDGCNSNCQNEKCVTQTVGARVECNTNGDCTAPRTCDQVSGICVPWLCDEGNFCTTDTCNTTLNGGTCQHSTKNCGDAINCTTDTCNAANGNCVHTPSNAACNDDNVCTSDTCNAINGCGYMPNAGICDDQNECTENDTCVASVCTGTPIGGCGFCGDGNLNGAEVCDDGNATFAPGEYCGLACAVQTACGDPNNSGTITSSDAQYALRAAVGQVKCCYRVCNVDSIGAVVASDAQRILRKAVGQSVTFVCPTTGNQGCPVP